MIPGMEYANLQMEMIATEVSIDPDASRGSQSAGGDVRNLEKVRRIFTALAKYINAKTIYTSNNPNVAHFAGSLRDSFREFFANERELLLSIEQYEIKWRDEIVYENRQKTESIAFLFYKDGVGELIIQSSVEPSELEQFVDLIRSEIHNPSPHLDIVSRLWQAEFTNISYRVFDDQGNGTSGDGKGSGSDVQEHPLRINDHPGLPGTDDCEVRLGARADDSPPSLASYFLSAIEGVRPRASPREKEECIQTMLESSFAVKAEDLRSWRDAYEADRDKNELLHLLRIMLDFTREHRPAPLVRDILDIIERLVHYAVEEADLPTLTAVLDIEMKMAGGPTLPIDFQSLPGRMRDELASGALIVSLGKEPNRSPEGIRQVLQYFQLIGRDATPGVCELLAHLTDSSLHEEACDTLLAIAADDIAKIVEGFDVDSPSAAKDAIYLLQRSMTDTVHPIIKRIVQSPNAQVRGHSIEYLTRMKTDEAAELLCRFLADSDATIRIRTLAAAEEFRHPLMLDSVTALCRAEDFGTRSAEELEHMFRAFGKLAGEDALPMIQRMMKRRGWLPSAKARRRQNTLLAITALRCIPGDESGRILQKLAKAGDSLVRTKAQYALRERDTTKPRHDERAPVRSEARE
jgi:hypothetical protein